MGNQWAIGPHRILSRKRWPKPCCAHRAMARMTQCACSWTSSGRGVLLALA
jgi:hypothetical protein